MSDDLFARLRDESRWKTHHDYYKIVEAEAERDLRKASEENRQLAHRCREYIAENFELKLVTESTQAEAESVLLEGRAVGVDGTQLYYPLLSGGRAQVAVATVSYANRRASASIYLSEYDFSTSVEDVIEALRARRPSNLTLSQLAVRALMRYKEIELALNREEPWLLLNGTYFPYELRSGAGSLRVVEPSVALLRKLAERGTAVSVIARSRDWHILSLGLGLSSGEYLSYDTLDTELSLFLNGDIEQGIAPANLRGPERQAFISFMNEVAPKIKLGLAKIGARSYQFQAHEAYFDRAANIVIRDGMFQPIRGYPMLIDYADSILHRLSPGSDLTRMIEFKLQKHHNLLIEQDEHTLRRR